MHLGLRDWCVLAAIALPLIASYLQLSIAFARMEANMEHVITRLEMMEARK